MRDLRIDFLRFLGLSLVILAHIQAPFTLTQIRSFDVPLMVFVSGLTASGKSISNYWQYIWKRTKRLVVPVWLFLALYLTVFSILQRFVLPEPYLTDRMVLRSFLLLDESIGYVWIIRVFLLVMLITPLVVQVSVKVKSDFVYCTIIMVLLFLDQFFVHLSAHLNSRLAAEVIEDYIVYGVAYIVPFSLGVRLKDVSKKSMILYGCFLLFVFILLCLNSLKTGHNPVGISAEYKFPPRPYFIVYGSLISVLLWTTKKWWGRITNNRITSFIGQNTIWIYLWHIPFALFATVFMHNWFFKYVFVFGLAFLFFWVQYKVVKKINNSFLSRYLLG